MEMNLIIWAFVPFLLFGLILGCSPIDGEEPTLDQNIYYSDIVVYGTAKRRLEDPKYGHFDSAYMVEFEVMCSYKGGPLPQMINITGAGKSMFFFPLFFLSKMSLTGMCGVLDLVDYSISSRL